MNGNRDKTAGGLSPRGRAAYDAVRFGRGVTNAEVAAALEPEFGRLHRNTVGTDLRSLVDGGLIEREGAGGADVRYVERIPNPGHRSFDVGRYFARQADEREPVHPFFNPGAFGLMEGAFTAPELSEVSALASRYREAVSTFGPARLRREMERFTVELAWKSARIEGNTYSLIDTEILLKQQREAEGHERREAIELVNHKKAIDLMRGRSADFREIDVGLIVELHATLVEGLDVAAGIRDGGVGIIGTNYRPLGSRADIEGAMERLVTLLADLEEPVEKAFAAVVLVSYVQPFFDGNKRTARILGNGILLAHDLPPLSYRSVDEAEYKRAMLLFYEQNSFRRFKELFLEQIGFSVENYFSDRPTA